MENKQMLQLVVLGTIAFVSGMFIYFGMFAVFIWLWFALLIAAVLSFMRHCGIEIGFS